MNQAKRSQNHLNGRLSKSEYEIPPRLSGLEAAPVLPFRFDDRQNRLDSWKEIAVYLDREVRTVQRWEKLEHLPVHRHFHHKVGSIFAFKNEIDNWRKSRSVIPCLPVSPSEKPAADASLVLLGSSGKKDLTPLARSSRNVSLAWAKADSICAVIHFGPDAIALTLRPDSTESTNLSAVAIPLNQGRSLNFKTRRIATAKS